MRDINDLQISYVGIMYHKRWSEAFVDALIAFNADPSTKTPWRWTVAGKMSESQRESAARLGHNFTYCGYVDVHQARQIMVDSDLLVIQVIQGDNAQGNVPGKLYDYLATGKPILCLQPSGIDSETAMLIRKHRAGFVCDTSDVGSIRRVLSEVALAKSYGTPMKGATVEEVQTYDRGKQTGRLSEVFDQVLGHGSAISHAG